MALYNNLNVKIPIERQHQRKVTFPKTPNLDLALITASLTSEMHSHDVLTLNFSGKINDSSNAVVSGDPVVFTWNSGQIDRTYLGYVTQVYPTTVADNMTKITCLSPTYVLKDANQKIFKNVTADMVVKKIAEKYGLKVVTDKHPRVFASIVQAGQSDWQILRRLAKQTGFTLTVINTTIYFVSKNRLANASRSSAPYFYVNTTNKASRVATKLGTIYSFEPILSDESPDMPGAVVDRAVSGFHAVTGAPIDVTYGYSTSNERGNGVIVPNAEFFA
jgi:hypothetical protein